MKLRAREIELLVAELDEALRDARVQKIYDGRLGEILIELRQPGWSSRLLISSGSVMARIHLVEERVQPPGQPTPYVSLLRKHLSGSRLREVRAIENERIAFLRFEGRSRGETGGPEEAELVVWQLVVELSGRHGNQFLLDSGGRILGSLRANVSRRRNLVVGEEYILPRRVESGPTEPSSSLERSSLSQSGSLDERPDGVFEQVADESDALSQAGRAKSSLSRLVEQGFQPFLANFAIEQARSALSKRIRQKKKQLARRLEKVEADLARADKAEHYTRCGQLLQSAYGRVERGARSVEVPDYFASDLATLEIGLEPALSLKENVARYFKEGRRLGAARDRVAERLEETRLQHDRMAAALTRAEEAADLETLASLSEELERRRDLNRVQQPREQPQSGRLRESSASALPYKEFRSKDGQTILVGKGARENDQLTFRVARGNDFWFHAAGISGSHVIVRLSKNEELTQESLLDAATLAAHYSKLSKESMVEVRYARQRAVRKIKGAPVGQVTVSQSKVLAIRIDPARLKRLQADRVG